MYAGGTATYASAPLQKVYDFGIKQICLKLKKDSFQQGYLQQRFGNIAADGTRISTFVFQFGVPSLLDGTQPNWKSIFQLINYIHLL